MFPAGNKAKRFLSVNHTRKTIYHHSFLIIIKFVAHCNLNSDLWDLTELLKIMNLELTAGENCEDNSDRITNNEKFMSENCLGFTSALCSQP